MTHLDWEFTSRTDLRVAIAAVLVGLSVHAAPLFSQPTPPPAPGRPGVPTPITKGPPGPPVLQPAIRPGAPTRGAVEPVMLAPELEDLRAKGAAPTSVRVTASSPVAALVAWEIPPCAAGSRIYVGLAALGPFRKVFESDSMPAQASCAKGAEMGPRLEQARGGRAPRVMGDAASLGAASPAHTVDLLQPGTTYFFKVTAFYRDSAPGAAAVVSTTMPPPPPITIAVVRPYANAIYLAWHRVDHASSYRVDRDNALLADIEPRSGTGAAPDTTYDDNGVKPAVSYSYRIDAVFHNIYTSLGVIPDRVVSVTAVVKTLYPTIVGIADTHAHPFANLAFGGKMFWGQAFGPDSIALAWCTPSHGPGGLGDIIGNIAADVRIGHAVGGWPLFDGWPRWNTLDHQQMYSAWIYRAYQGGLRLMVAHAVNNGLLCGVANKAPGRTCDDMEAVDLQITAAKQMESYIDAQSGGSGRGWFRIAYTPEQARQIILDGKLAVVLGIEVDAPFGCAFGVVAGPGGCDAATLQQKLSAYYLRGIRHLVPVHFADNLFAGYAVMGTMFRVNNYVLGSGSSATEEDCSAFGFVEKCNARGLTPLGEQLITSMMNRGMIIDVDHMSKHTSDRVLALTAARQYPVIAGHTGFVATSIGGKKAEGQKTESQMAAIRSGGGMVSVILHQGDVSEIATYTPSWRGAIENSCGESSKSWLQAYLYAVDRMGGPDVAAVGLATDQFMNKMIGPRFDGSCVKDLLFPLTRVSYPITTQMPGVVLARSVTGQRTFDFNTDGLAHVGLLPDFVQDLKNDGLTTRDLAPLFRSAEGYIQMWEKAVARSVLP